MRLGNGTDHALIQASPRRIYHDGIKAAKGRQHARNVIADNVDIATVELRIAPQIAHRRAFQLHGHHFSSSLEQGQTERAYAAVQVGYQIALV